MDRFELQQEVWDSQREVASFRAKIQTGQTTAIAGMSVLFTSLGVMVAQSLMTGTLSASQMLPVAAGAATGLASTAWKAPGQSQVPKAEDGCRDPPNLPRIAWRGQLGKPRSRPTAQRKHGCRAIPTCTPTTAIER